MVVKSLIILKIGFLDDDCSKICFGENCANDLMQGWLSLSWRRLSGFWSNLGMSWVNSVAVDIVDICDWENLFSEIQLLWCIKIIINTEIHL